MTHGSALPVPVLSAWDPRASASGSIDPLGALRPYTAIATTLFPGVTTITTRVRYLSWVCAGLKLLDETENPPMGGRAGKARRRRLLGWERLVSLATGLHARQAKAAEDDLVWRQLRGVTYVKRAITTGVRSADFPMLRNQAGVGGVGTYWVTLVAGGLVEDHSATLTPRGVKLADSFLKGKATPPREELQRVLQGKSAVFSEAVLAAWGRSANLAGGGVKEKRLLADALLEPSAHRHMAAAMRDVDAFASDSASFDAIARYLNNQHDAQSARLASAAEVTVAFEHVHAALLYRFNQLRAVGSRLEAPLAEISLATDDDGLEGLAARLNEVITARVSLLTSPVARALTAFSQATSRVCRAHTEQERVRELVRHHERVQSGKLDAARQPKRPWMELQGSKLRVAPRYALDERPGPPGAGAFTHPYRIEQLAALLREADAWAESA